MFAQRVRIAVVVLCAVTGCGSSEPKDPGTGSSDLVAWAGPTCGGNWGCTEMNARADFSILVEDEQFGSYIDSRGGTLDMVAFVIRFSMTGTFDLTSDPGYWPHQRLVLQLPSVTRNGATTSIVIPHAEFCSRVIDSAQSDQVWFWYGEGQYMLQAEAGTETRRILFVSPVPQWIMCEAPTT